MKRLALAFSLISAPALAEREITEATPPAIDCKKDPAVVINHGNGKYTFTGACTKIRVQGSGNKLTIESVKELAIAGSGNDAEIVAVDKIGVSGAKNKVRYKKSVTPNKKTAVAGVGVGNEITQQK